MSNIILLHGSPTKEEFETTPFIEHHWMKHLQNLLTNKGLTVTMPELPEPYDPSYTGYTDVFSTLPINESTTLIGHSSGAGFILQYLSEHSDVIPEHLILVAPWIDPDDTLSDPSMFTFTTDTELTNKMKIDMLISTDDDDEVLRSADSVSGALPGITIHTFNDHGHFDELTFELQECLLSLLKV